MNFVSTQGYIDSHPLNQPAKSVSIGEGYRNHRIYAALTGATGDWCECEIHLLNRRGLAGRLPLKMFKPVAQGYFPSDSAFASSDQPPAAPNVITVQFNYTGDVLYLFPTYVAEEIVRVAIVPTGYSFPSATYANFYLGIVSENR